MKKCSKCKQLKSLSEFVKDKREKDGLNTQCKSCSREYALYYDQSLHGKNIHRAYNRSPKGKEAQLKFDYHITLEVYNEMLKNQNGVCAICKEPPAGKHKCDKVLCVDHDRKTGQVRRLLCHNCNLGIGHFKENIILLQNAINYLKET
jgi:Recombination endonuclease VII